MGVVENMAADWNLPLITPVGTSANLGDKSGLPTLTRLSHSFMRFAEFHKLTLLHFNWTDVAFIYDTGSFASTFNAENAETTFSNDPDITLTLVPYDPRLGEDARRGALLKASYVARGLYR